MKNTFNTEHYLFIAQDAPVTEYQLPFESEVGLHPTLDDMQECVVTQKNRPHISLTWLNHPVRMHFLKANLLLKLIQIWKE